MTTRPVIARKNDKATKIYRSLSATAKDGFDPSTVSKVLRGDRDIHNGHTFHTFKGNVVNLIDAMGNREVITAQAATKGGFKV